MNEVDVEEGSVIVYVVEGDEDEVGHMKEMDREDLCEGLVEIEALDRHLRVIEGVL